MDEKDGVGKDISQNEGPLPDDLKQLHQNQDMSRNGEQEGSQAETRPAQRREVNTKQLPSREKDSKHGEKDDGEREVTDPITHLPVTIHDFTSQELNHALENIPLTGSQQLPVSDAGETPKSNIQDNVTASKELKTGTEKLFTPAHAHAKLQLVKIFRFALNVGMGVILSVMALILRFVQLSDASKKLSTSDKASQTPWAGSVLAIFTLEAVVLGCGLWAIRIWVENKVDDFWEDQTQGDERQSEIENAEAPPPESTQWLNSILAAVWPLVNPGLFASLADTLEDSMQASLPTLVNMIGVEDLGQGSEAPRILGVRWLPSDATACLVSGNTKIHGESDSQEGTGYEERNSQQQSQKIGQDSKHELQKEQEQSHMADIKAEEGDSVSLEVSFAYRARPAGRSLSTKAKNAHLFLAIYLRAGIRLRKHFLFPCFGFDGILPTHEDETYSARLLHAA